MGKLNVISAKKIDEKHFMKRLSGKEPEKELNKLVEDIKAELEYIEKNALDKEKGRTMYAMLLPIYKRLLKIKKEVKPNSSHD